MAIEFYKEFGDLGYLANYSNHGFTKNGIYYKTVEHYYQSEKFDNEIIKAQIIAAPTPKEASCIGRDRNNIRRSNFRDIKDQVMYEGVLEKFRQNRDIACKLIETRNEPIAEATIDEYYWGIGKNRTGENHIGQILVDVRSQIKSEILSSIIEESKKYPKVYIIGHKSPDADSIFSSYILSNILKSLGINAVFAILDKNYDYCKSDKKLIDSYLKIKPTIISSDNKPFILVDHNNLEGINGHDVIGAIDHHILTYEVPNTIEIEYSSTCLLIYDLFKSIYPFSEYEKKLIYLSVLADTEYLTSARYGEEDQKLVSSLNISLDVKSIQQECFMTNDFKEGIEYNLQSNYKEYVRNGQIIKRSLIYSYTSDYLMYFSDYVSYLKKLNEDYLLIWCDFESQKTYVYYNSSIKEYDYITTSTNIILKKIL